MEGGGGVYGGRVGGGAAIRPRESRPPLIRFEVERKKESGERAGRTHDEQQAQRLETEDSKENVSPPPNAEAAHGESFFLFLVKETPQCIFTPAIIPLYPWRIKWLGLRRTKRENLERLGKKQQEKQQGIYS